MNIPHFIKTRRPLIIAAALILSSAVAANAAPASMKIQWSATPLQIQIDGKLNDAAWKNADMAARFNVDQTEEQGLGKLHAVEPYSASNAMLKCNLAVYNQLYYNSYNSCNTAWNPYK